MLSVRFVCQISWNCFKELFPAKFSLPPKLVPDHLEAPTVSQKWLRKTQKTRENALQEGVREKCAKIANKLSPRAVQIYDFTLEVLQKQLYPPFAHHRNKCWKKHTKIDQKSMKYRSGDGTKKKNNHKLFVPDFPQKMSQNGSRKGGGKVQFYVIFSLGRILAPKVSPWSSRVTPRSNFPRF